MVFSDDVVCSRKLCRRRVQVEDILKVEKQFQKFKNECMGVCVCASVCVSWWRLRNVYETLSGEHKSVSWMPPSLSPSDL